MHTPAPYTAHYSRRLDCQCAIRSKHSPRPHSAARNSHTHTYPRALLSRVRDPPSIDAARRGGAATTSASASPRRSRTCCGTALPVEKHVDLLRRSECARATADCHAGQPLPTADAVGDSKTLALARRRGTRARTCVATFTPVARIEISRRIKNSRDISVPKLSDDGGEEGK